MASRHIRLLTIDGLTLSGDLVVPDGTVRAAVAVAHPHPLYGGDRFNPVVDALFRALPTAGCAVVRFDFRGVGDSEGTHDDGNAERLDMAAAIELLDTVVEGVPIVAAGYSFGSLVALGVTDPRVAGWFAVAAPLRPGSARPLAADDHRPKHLLVPEHDQYCPPATAAEATADWSTTTSATVVMADHFLAGGLGVVAEAATTFVSELAAR